MEHDAAGHLRITREVAPAGDEGHALPRVQEQLRGVQIARDLALGFFRPKVKMPRDEMDAADLVPFVGFATEIEGLRKRQKGVLKIEVDRWYFTRAALWGKEQTVCLGEKDQAVLTKGVMGITLRR